ncbi:EFP [Choristoneura occidentalis granulovirus]|uniref:EFP n=1 Tax=Choristoneura occidentalis granulovirus TaxID=364745 RepID=Q1A4S3_9BBAC|nr:EFP [Choristoneura fumiferana granulovirus]ABC61157.1 EFP [Choristoneura fumiferana granulovirus]
MKSLWCIIAWLVIKTSKSEYGEYGITPDYSIVPITKAGFHYEFQSTLGFVVNTWSFILNIEYTLLKNRLFELKALSNTLHNKTEKCLNNKDIYQREISYIINRKIANLLETHNSIEYLLVHKKLPKKSKRTKRGFFGGAFNFVGRANKYFFGVMDDNDAALLYELSNHTNNTDYRIKVLTNETLHIAENLKNIKHKIEDQIDCKLDSQLIYLKDNLEEIETTYNKIITGIQTALYSNKLSSLIINPNVLLDEMLKIDSKAYDKETEWVIKPSFEDMHTVMHIVQCNVFINPLDQLMFVIQVPRMDKSKFDMYKPVSLPDCDKNKMCKFLIPQSQYIGFEVKGESKHYVRLDDTSTCTKLDNLTLCYGSMTSKKSDYSPNCDVRLFRGLNHNNNCEVHATQFQNEIFYSLNNANKWLFMVNEKPINAQLNCGSGRYNKQITLQGTGILTLLNYCKLRTSRSKLMSKHVLNYNENACRVVNFNFSQFLIPLNYRPYKIVKSLDFTTLTDVTHNLKKLLTQEETDSVLKLPPADDNSYANWYSNLFGNWWWELKFIVYSVCIIVVIVFVLKIKNMCCKGDRVYLSPSYN